MASGDPRLSSNLVTTESSVNPRNHRRRALGIILALRSERRPQQLLLAAHADNKTDHEYDNRYPERDPVLHREPGRDQHPEHARINRIANIGVRPRRDQLVPLD